MLFTPTSLRVKIDIALQSLAGGGLLTRRSSQLSLVSVGSTASASKNRDYADKFMEVRSFRDALVNHV